MEINKHEIYSQALAEVSVILEHTNPDLVQMIPKKFLDYIWQNKDKNYEVNISSNLSLEDQEIKDETKSIMALIYRNYFCTQEEREKFDGLLNNNQIEYEKALNEKYSYENIFKNNSLKRDENNQLIEYKEENILQKIIKKIKAFFRKNPS